MTLAERRASNQIADVRFDDRRMYVLLRDSREISVPLWWYPRLLRATSEQRNNWETLPFGDALRWPDIDEDLDVDGFLIGAKAPAAIPSVEKHGVVLGCNLRGASDLWPRSSAMLLLLISR